MRQGKAHPDSLMNGYRIVLYGENTCNRSDGTCASGGAGACGFRKTFFSARCGGKVPQRAEKRDSGRGVAPPDHPT